jgi:uncharacterized membrane protein
MSTFHVMAGGERAELEPQIRRIDLSDVRGAIVDGWRDFLAMRSDVLLVALIYPLIGVALAVWSSGADALPLLYPLAVGFALLGPLAAIGLYEISRRREAGEAVSARNAFDVLKSPSMPSILALAFGLALVFLAWLASAQALYQALFGAEPPTSLSHMLREILSTRTGWRLIVLGNAVGLAFAAVTFCATAISLPLLLDRDVGLAVAVRASFEAVKRNPVEMAVWAAVIAAGLAIGFLTCFVGLAIVMPVLGHATWRMYRALVGPPRR